MSKTIFELPNITVSRFVGQNHEDRFQITINQRDYASFSLLEVYEMARAILEEIGTVLKKEKT